MKLEGVPLSVVLVNGLADGINPCALTTLVFLVSFLQHEGLPRRRVLLVGSGYIGAVFFTYFAIMIGLWEAFRYVSALRWVGVGVSLLAIGIALWFAVMHVRDLLVFLRTKKTSEMIASIPRPWVARMHAAIREGLRSRSLFLGASAAGFLVAIIESACTGQFVVPTVVYLVRERRAASEVALAFGYLAIHNLAFILPLLVVFGLTLAGMSSSRLAEFTKAHFSLTKTVLAIVLLWFALVLGILVWKEVAAGV